MKTPLEDRRQCILSRKTLSRHPRKTGRIIVVSREKQLSLNTPSSPVQTPRFTCDARSVLAWRGEQDSVQRSPPASLHPPPIGPAPSSLSRCHAASQNPTFDCSIPKYTGLPMPSEFAPVRRVPGELRPVLEKCITKSISGAPDAPAESTYVGGAMQAPGALSKRASGTTTTGLPDIDDSDSHILVRRLRHWPLVFGTPVDFDDVVPPFSPE